jgi:hypothetical protein
MVNYLNLTEVGVVTQTGKDTDQVTNEVDTLNRTHQSEAEATRSQLDGRAANAMYNTWELSTENAVRLGREYGTQAVNMVRGEQMVVDADDTAATEYGSALSAFDGGGSHLGRQI